jgi:hypothetical protein
MHGVGSIRQRVSDKRRVSHYRLPTACRPGSLRNRRELPPPGGASRTSASLRAAACANAATITHLGRRDRTG